MHLTSMLPAFNQGLVVHIGGKGVDYRGHFATANIYNTINTQNMLINGEYLTFHSGKLC